MWVLSHDLNSKVSWLDLPENEHHVIEALFRNSFLNILTKMLKEQKEFWSYFCHLYTPLGGLCLQVPHDCGGRLTLIHETLTSVIYLQTLHWADFWHQLTGDASGSSLHICRNLSGRADECSGPWGRHKMEQEDKSDVLQAYWSLCRRMLQISMLPFPPCHEEVAGRCHSVEPIWPDLNWWTGQWCTELCCENLQTGPPTEPVHLDWP